MKHLILCLFFIACTHEKPEEPSAYRAEELDRLPCFTNQRDANGGFVDAINFGELTAIIDIGMESDLPNVFRRELRQVVPSALLGSTMQTALTHILFTSNPSQIGYVVIPRVPVQMGSMSFTATGRSWPNKRLQHDPMYSGSKSLAVKVEKNAFVTLTMGCWRQEAGRFPSVTAIPQRFNTSAIRYLVVPFVSNNWLPDFFGGHV